MYDCEICGIGPGCLCTVHECSAYYYPASKEQVIDRLYKGLYKNHRDNMKKYLKDTFGVTFIDHSESPGERRITMNDDTISRQAAIDEIEAYFGDLPIVVHYDMLQLIKKLPSAERRGRWVFNIDDKGWSWDKPYMCDQCGEWVEKVFKFCPNCGAKMEEGEK